MKSEKEQILEVINNLPDNTTWDDIFYTLYFYSELKQSENDFKNGRFITLEEFDKEMEAKYEGYNVKQSRTKY